MLVGKHFDKNHPSLFFFPIEESLPNEGPSQVAYDRTLAYPALPVTLASCFVPRLTERVILYHPRGVVLKPLLWIPKPLLDNGIVFVYNYTYLPRNFKGLNYYGNT